MWSQSNNPSVSLETRRWLGELAAQGDRLDRESWATIQRAVEACASVHPGGLVMDLSLALGAGDEAARVAGSCAEVFYVVCSLTDDIQDGDTGSYLEGVSLPLAVNAQAHLLCLAANRVIGLEPWIGRAHARALVVTMYETGASMLTGQHREITRRDWGLDAYERVAHLSAGRQFAFYLELAASVAGADPRPWSSFGSSVGRVVQLARDHETGDERLEGLDPEDVSTFGRALVRTLRSRAADIGGPAPDLSGQLADHLEECLRDSR